MGLLGMSMESLLFWASCILTVAAVIVFVAIRAQRKSQEKESWRTDPRYGWAPENFPKQELQDFKPKDGGTLTPDMLVIIRQEVDARMERLGVMVPTASRFSSASSAIEAVLEQELSDQIRTKKATVRFNLRTKIRLLGQDVEVVIGEPGPAVPRTLEEALQVELGKEVAKQVIPLVVKPAPGDVPQEQPQITVPEVRIVPSTEPELTEDFEEEEELEEEDFEGEPVEIPADDDEDIKKIIDRLRQKT